AAAEAALCFASSTLELGIDIGSIDIVLLIGAPGSADAFTQRIGRASRRQKTARAACFYRSPFERVLFEGLLHFSSTFAPPTPFRPSAAVQQIFSLLKQSPSGGIRLQPMLLHFDGLLNAAELESIFGELQAAGYLANGRPGEWRAGARLHRLVDMQGSEYAPLSLHSNIQSQGGTVAVRDQHTQRVIARLDRAMLDRNALVLEGRSLRIAWSDGDAVWIAGQGQAATQQRFRGRAARPVVSGGVARQIRAALTLPDDSAPYVEGESGWLWFHWLGDIHGRALLDLLGERLTLKASTQTALCVLLMEKPRELPLAFTSEQVLRYLHGHYRTYESLLALGAYHSLLPLGLRRRAVVDGFDVPAFLAAVAGLRVEAAPEATSTALWEIVELP
ncbi:MAG: helicase-related protein, partial [Chloroflexota bacterium]|nr:helicase-related protein [Chloroflexota bacterium]